MRSLPVRVIFFVLLLTLSGRVFAAEPTVPPSKLVFSNITCSSGTIQWTVGDGAWNIVVVREGAAVNGPPVDGVKYTAFSTFGNGDETTTGNKNYVCFSNLTTTFTLTGLKMNTTYYVCVYGHDGAASPDYLTSSAACGSFTTSNVSVDFDFSYSDTCQNTNKVKLWNKSSVSFTGAQFIWRLYNAPPAFDQAYADTITYTWTKPGNKKIELYLVPKGGCTGIATKSLLIYSRAKPFPYVVGQDTQCYDHGNNHFFFNENTTADNATGIGLRRTWYFPSDTFTLPNPDVKSLLPGNYNIRYVGYTIFNNRPTGCYDTAYLPIRVVPDPTSGVIINDTVQCMKGNQFQFDNVYPGLVSFTWDFGDGSAKSTLKNVNHSYSSIGNYEVIHNAASQEGCVSADTSIVKVKPNVNPSFSSLPPTVCESANPVKMLPNTPGGIFSGPFVSNDSFFPKTPGNFSVKYLIPDIYCPDSSTQGIIVTPLPRFSLGRDSNLCNGGSANLSISQPGSYLWDDGTTQQTRSTSAAGLFWGQVTNNGCSWRDSINLFVGFSPTVSLPDDTLMCKGGVLRLHAYSPNTKTTWSTGSNDTTIYITNPGTYTVTLSNPCGTATDQVTVYYQGQFCDVFVPDAFTPNSDGKNELFQITGRGINPTLMIIYNRWGQIVFDSRVSNTFGWDGSYMGQTCMDGVYTWLFTYEVPVGTMKRRNTLRGSVLLYR